MKGVIIMPQEINLILFWPLNLSRYPFGSDPANVSAMFSDFAAGGTYQQVYFRNAFSGPVTITQIAFASRSQLTSGHR